MAAITDIRAYATLLTDDLPRYLARDAANKIWIDSGGSVGQLSGSSQGACMIPYRPNQSPQAWMYVASQEDYKKYSAPDIVTGAVTENEVGIEEQQQPPEACPNEFEYTDFSGGAADYVQGGTAGASSDTVRIADTAGVVLLDPAGGTGVNSRASVEVASTKSYQIGLQLLISGTVPASVQDVLPAVNNGTAITIQSVFYFSGTTGRCVMVPTQGPVASNFQSPGVPQSLYQDNALAGLRRGSIVQLTGAAGTEKLFVLSTAVGPLGTVCFELITTKAFVAGDSIKGIPAITLSALTAANAGGAISAIDLSWAQVGSGKGYQDRNFGAVRPFNIIGVGNNATTQQYDYVALSLNINDLSLFVSATFIFNVDNTVNYTDNTFYFQIFPEDLVPHPTQTSVLPVAMYTTFLVPITSFKRMGDDPSRTLNDANGFRVQVEATGNISVRSGLFFIGIGDQPDVGETGAAYRYLVRTRSTVTGAASNPSPPMRYGVGPRRQSVRLTARDTNSDTQDNVWDFYREGGTINSFRYIGSTPNTGGVDVFTDNFFDTAAEGGSLVEYDNFQPWPTIDVPFNVVAGGGSGITIRINVYGTVVLVTYYSASVFTDPTPDTITRWLPGTLMTLDGLNVYTLWNRPTLVTLASPPAAHYYAYMFRIVENAGSATPQTLSVNEPNVANQPMPYLWGPDAEGTVFGCGDTFRPGNVYFCKSFTPDSAPDKYNQEITNPSEPLMGGDVINGLALVASTQRWWALYPNFGTGNRYQAVEAPVKRGLVAPYAHACDGQQIYFWGKDGIWTTMGQSLTDADLHNLFPHEGVPGQDYQYGGHTVYAPDYKYASLFRLCYKNSYLYADYRDSEGLPRTLVCDLRDPANPAWSVDEYADPIGVHYAVEQQAGTLLAETSTYEALVMGDDNGLIHVQEDLANDRSEPIDAAVATQEFNGGDVRGNELFNDQFLDLIPAASAGVVATILEGGAAVQATVTIASSTARVHTNVPIGLELSYMGVLLEWTDDFDIQSVATVLRSWQPMFQSVPLGLFLWKNQGTGFNIPGYKHIPRILFAYKATAPVTLTITVYDGTSPTVITLPSTGGAYRKTLFWLTPNKGMLYFFTALCADAEWQPYLIDCEFYVGGWERSDNYQIVRDIQTALGVGEG